MSRAEMIDEAVRRIAGPRVLQLLRGYVQEYGEGPGPLIHEDDADVPAIRAEFRRIEAGA